MNLLLLTYFLLSCISLCAFDLYSPISHTLSQGENLYELDCFSATTQKWLSKQTISLEQLKTDKPRYKDVRKIYNSCNAISSQIDKTSNIAAAKANRKKNRYRTILPYDSTRTARDLDGFYINASDVSTQKQQYVITQAPLENTANDFWKMIIYKEIPLIITLAMPIENGSKKGYAYWEKKHFPQLIEGKVIQKKSEQTIAKSKSGQKIVLRTFDIYTPYFDHIQTVSQIHYEGWPDFKTPDRNLFIKLLEVVEQQMPPSKAMCVHCSAGIGRAGTFVASHSLVKEILFQKSKNKSAKDIFINIPKRVLEIRLQRPRLISRAVQLHFIYKTIARHF